MKEQDIKEINLKHISHAAQALVAHIESILASIPSDRVRQIVSLKLGSAISVGDERMLRQLLLLAITAITNAKLVEQKHDANDLDYNPISQEYMSELDYLPALNSLTKVMKEIASKQSVKNAPNPNKPRSGE